MNKRAVLSLPWRKTHGQEETRITLSFFSRLGCTKTVSAENLRGLGRTVGKGVKAADRQLDLQTLEPLLVLAFCEKLYLAWAVRGP